MTDWYVERGPTKIRHVQHLVHGHDWWGHFNQAVATRITKAVGTMWTAYAFALLALISFPAAVSTGDPIVIVAWVAQTFIQLVLLPVIIVGQNIQSAHADARAEDDHHILSELYRLQKSQLEILEILRGKK